MTLSRCDENGVVLAMERELSRVTILTLSSKFELILQSLIRTSLHIYAYNAQFYLALSALQKKFSQKL